MIPAHYDPARLLVFASTPYQHAHEWAHIDQEARRTIIWRVWNVLKRTRAWPLPLVLVEIEAAFIASLTLKSCGVWEPGDAKEAMDGLWTYLAAFTD